MTQIERCLDTHQQNHLVWQGNSSRILPCRTAHKCIRCHWHSCHTPRWKDSNRGLVVPIRQAGRRRCESSVGIPSSRTWLRRPMPLSNSKELLAYLGILGMEVPRWHTWWSSESRCWLGSRRALLGMYMARQPRSSGRQTGMLEVRTLLVDLGRAGSRAARDPPNDSSCRTSGLRGTPCWSSGDYVLGGSGRSWNPLLPGYTVRKTDQVTDH